MKNCKLFELFCLYTTDANDTDNGWLNIKGCYAITVKHSSSALPIDVNVMRYAEELLLIGHVDVYGIKSIVSLKGDDEFYGGVTITKTLFKHNNTKSDHSDT